MVNPNPEFWHGKKVLITGHTGFKGGWLCTWLRRLGAHVSGYALEAPSDPSLFSALDLTSKMNSIYGDVRDLAHLQTVISEGRFDIIVHLAAQSLVRESYVSPVETYATNVMGTVNVMQAVRESRDVRVLINVTSDKCYENTESQMAFTEHHPMGGFDPYSSSKGCSELVTSAFRNSFFASEKYQEHGTGVASARAGNVIGGGDWAKDRLIPDIMQAFSKQKTVLIRNPHATRPWQHVLEPLSGYLLLAEALWRDGAGSGEGWNFGPLESDAKPVSWIVNKLADAWGEGAKWEIDDGRHPHEAKYLKLDITKARQRLQYQPRLTLAETLKWVVEWYQAYAANADVNKSTLEQIHRFEHYEI